MQPQHVHAAAIVSMDKALDNQPYQPPTVAMDNGEGSVPDFKVSKAEIPEALLGWYASARFIGYQLCAVIAQHWLVDKACSMPARDAVRHGFDVQVYGDKTPLSDEEQSRIIEQIKRADRNHKLTRNMVQFIRMGRTFGVRLAYFKVDGIDYSAPFNPDGIKPDSYQGIVQIDPSWCAPLLSAESAGDPTSLHFYEPEWWVIRGQKFHRSHLCIFRNGDLPDLLKPMYLYGGVSVPQRIMERVYGAERTANEAPMLAMTKRLTVQNTDLAIAYADQEKFATHLAQWTYYRDNYGIKFTDTDDTVQQFDTSLADLDAVIMSQYQIVAAAAGVPATKLLGTTPKGFNSSGEYETTSYHEELETIQENDLTDFVNRHHLCVARSEGISPDIRIEINWASVDSPSAKDYAEINKINAETDASLLASGAIDAMDIRNRLRTDNNSGYTDLPKLEEPDMPGEEGDDPDLGAMLESLIDQDPPQSPPLPEA